MKVFAENIITNYGLSRIADAIKKYAPGNIEFTDHEKSADLVIIYAYGQRRKIEKRIKWIGERGQKYAMVQTAIRSTANPNTRDWQPMWEKAEVVWSYYDLLDLCDEDNNTDTIGAPFNFYYAPLGVDSEVFRDKGLDRDYTVVVGDNRDESVNEVIRAAKGDVFHLGVGLSEDELIAGYNKSVYVSGLRRKEGFELPVLEGLLCGARPICYNKPHYRHWFSNLAIFIPEEHPEKVVDNLREIFSQPFKPVTKQMKNIVREKFAWQPIIEGFWERIL